MLRKYAVQPHQSQRLIVILSMCCLAFSSLGLAPSTRAASGSIGGANPDTWQNLSLPGGPPVLQAYSMTYDYGDGYVLLFGGMLQNGLPVNSTWIFQDGSWTNISGTQSTAPSPRIGMAMVYDAEDGYVLAFGGYSVNYNCEYGGGVYCNDTWEFAGGHWAKLNPRCYDLGQSNPVHCGTRASMGAGTPITDDSAAGYVLVCTCNGLSGGIDLSYRADTWTDLSYNVSANQTRIAPDLGDIAYDPGNGIVIGFGSGINGATYIHGQGAENYTWEWGSNHTWRNITANVSGAPPDRYSDDTLIFDTSSRYVLLFGGAEFNCTLWISGSADCSKGVWRALSDTWEFRNMTWMNLTSSGSPGDRGFPVLADDPAEGGVLLAGGWNCGNTTWCNNGDAYFTSDFNWIWGPQHAPSSGAEWELGLSLGVAVGAGAVLASVIYWQTRRTRNSN